MKKLIFTAAALFFLTNVHAQDSTNIRSDMFVVSSEISTWVLAGSASIHFEGRITSSKTRDIAVYGRLGLMVGYIDPIFCKLDKFTGQILGLSAVNGSGNHHFELATGIYLLSDNKQAVSNEPLFSCEPRTKNHMAFVDLGYRYQKPEGGIIFRAKVGLLGIGLGLGYAF